jgi:hypothetical protein
VRGPSSVASLAATAVEPALVARSAARAPGEHPVALSAKEARSVPHVEGPRGVTPLVDGLRIELKAGETATVALANGQSSQVRGPCAVEFWSSANEVGGWRLTPVEPATSGILFADPTDPAKPTVAGPPPSTDGVAAPALAPAPSKRSRSAAPAASEPAPREASPPPPEALPPETPAGASVEGASPKVQAAWVRAADAQRRDDFAAADSAYGELGESSDAATRDAARLARAQLWMAHGRASQVRSVLVDLASHGATQLVRQTARECLSRQAQ